MITDLIPPAVNFAILVFVLAYFLRKPIREHVASRHAGVKRQVEEARARMDEAGRRYREFDEKLKAFEAEAGALLDRARHEGEEIKTRIIRDAYATAERIVKDADETAQASVSEYRDAIRRETIHKAVGLAEKMIRDRLSSDDQHRIVSEYVGKVN